PTDKHQKRGSSKHFRNPQPLSEELLLGLITHSSRCGAFFRERGKPFICLVRSRKGGFEREGKSGFPVGTEMLQSLPGLFYCRKVLTRNPPEGLVGAIELLKPATALLHDLAMEALPSIDKMCEGSQRSPHGHTEQDAVILVRANGG